MTFPYCIPSIGIFLTLGISGLVALVALLRLSGKTPSAPPPGRS